MLKIVCFGEVLWDIFPTHRTIGGAPLNVALRLNSFNHEVAMISSVGNDSSGKEILSFLTANSISVGQIQINNNFKTSEVTVFLDKKGSATYKIEFPCAWDHILLNDNLKNCVLNADAFVFGSLVTRNSVSRNTLYELLKVATFKVFDVNLRSPHYGMIILNELMQNSDFIKFNDAELSEICNHYNFLSNNLESQIKFISKQTNTDKICVTLGKDGALLLWNNTFYKNRGYEIKLKDTVGAGDSFLASLLSKLLTNKHPQEALDFACAIGAIVASSHGANPNISEKDINKYILI